MLAISKAFSIFLTFRQKSIKLTKLIILLSSIVMNRATSKAFLTSLALFSILGFLAVLSEVFFEFNLSMYTKSLLLIIIGFGFMVEGQVRMWKSQFKGGLTSNEFTHLITGIIGILAVILGILNFFLTGVIFNTMIGIVAAIAIIAIVIETWVVK